MHCVLLVRKSGLSRGVGAVYNVRSAVFAFCHGAVDGTVVSAKGSSVMRIVDGSRLESACKVLPSLLRFENPFLFLWILTSISVKI